MTRRALAAVVALAVLASCASDADTTDADEATPDPVEFCTRYAQMVADGFLSGDEVLGASPAQIEAAIDDNLTDVRFAAAVAPDEIAGDIDRMVDGVVEFQALLATYGYDLVQVTDEADPDEIARIQELLGGADFQASAERIDDYLDTSCAGLVPDTTAPAQSSEAAIADRIRGTFSAAQLDLLYDTFDVADTDALAALVVDGTISFDELDAAAAAPGGQPLRYGDDETLDGFYDACGDGDVSACDRLRLDAPAGSDYRSFGDTCGDRLGEPGAQSCALLLG